MGASQPQSMRVVLDANIYMSALINSKGIPSKIVQEGLSKRFENLISVDTFKEISRVVNYPKIRQPYNIDERKVQKFLLQIKQQSVFITPQKTVPIIKDESDNRYLECAEAGKAEVIVSGDKHFLNLKHYKKIRIENPASFWEMLKKNKGGIWTSDDS